MKVEAGLLGEGDGLDGLVRDWAAEVKGWVRMKGKMLKVNDWGLDLLVDLE